MTVEITSLPDGYLGAAAVGGGTIDISVNAAGYGWFLGTTPWRNRAPARRVGQKEFLADRSTAPAGHEDLLTVVMHELGHALGLSDRAPTKFPADLMAQTLATGVRRLPSARDVAEVLHERPLVVTYQTPNRPISAHRLRVTDGEPSL